MNLDASPETIRDTAEALKLASLLDDRVANADRARIAAWAEQIARNRLTREDLLSGLQDFYDGPSQYPIGIGDLVSHARSRKRERLEREPDAMREARQSQLDARVAEHMAVITTTLESKFTRPSQRDGVNPLTVRCPWCHASAGQHCTVPQTNRRPHGGAHPSRIEAAEATRHSVSGGAHANNP